MVVRRLSARWEGDRGWFSRLELNREAALRAGIPLIIWIETVANESDERYGIAPMPSDSPPKVRQSVYTSLAYGVKGIQWYHGSMLYERDSATLNEVGKNVRKITGTDSHGADSSQSRIG